MVIRIKNSPNCKGYQKFSRGNQLLQGSFAKPAKFAKLPVNQVNNVQYVLNAVNTATYNTNPAALQYNPIVTQTSNGTQYTFNYIQWQMYPQLLIDISITTDIVIVINNNGVVNVNQLQMVYECSYAPAFISNVLQIPYGGYLNTTFNNAPVQIVNYASEGFWQIGIGNN